MEEVNQLKVVKQTKEIENRHQAEMESLKKENSEPLRNYQAQTMKNLENYLLNLKSNILMYSQAVVGPFDIQLIDFDSLRDLANIELGFDVFFILEKWEEFK